jgi:hypothetical protein
MNSYEIIFLILTVFVVGLVLASSIFTLNETRKTSIEEYNQNKKTRKSRFDEKY